MWEDEPKRQHEWEQEIAQSRSKLNNEKRRSCNGPKETKIRETRDTWFNVRIKNERQDSNHRALERVSQVEKRYAERRKRGDGDRKNSRKTRIQKREGKQPLLRKTV